MRRQKRYLRSPKIVYENNHLLIVDKPAGMLSQGDDTGDMTILDWGKQYIKMQYNKPGAVFLGLAHRLDRPTSGLVMMARTSKALSRIQPMFAKNQIKKTYLAVVEGHVSDEPKTLVHWLKHDPTVKRMRVHTSERKAGAGAKRSELSYKLLGRVASHSLLEVQPTTGRRHQIRAQLAAAGHVIEGDMRYGCRNPLEDRSIGLHALRLEFNHPVGNAPINVMSIPDSTDAFKHFSEMLEDL